MDNKINDIHENLDEDIDITYIYIPKNINVKDITNNSTNDIINDLDDVFLWWKNHAWIHKSKTDNFDSVISNKRLKDIDLTEKPNFIENLYLWLIWRVTLSWNPVSFFHKRVFFSKNFFKKLALVFILIWIFLWIDALIIENRINSWYEKILSVKENSWDIDFVKKNINNARLDFILSDLLFKPFLLIPSDNIRNWYYILQWWKDLTKLLDKWIQSYLATKDFIDNTWWIENIRLTNLLTNLRWDLSIIIWLVYNTILSYDKVWELPSKSLNDKLNYAKNSLKKWYNLLDIINRDFDIFLNILWHNDERKYLVLFQNNDEIRATGWFIWSLATVTIKNGKVSDFIKDDVYAYEWEINKAYIDKNPAPEWLNKITETFWLRDANYFVDFESSSKSINFFLDKINKKVDWIIYINQNTVLDLLKLTWWIKLDYLDEEINEENFSLIISTLVEAQAFKIWTLWSPKQILFDFANIFIEKLKYDKDYFAYLDVLLKNIKSRDLVIYSFNPDENNLLWKLWLNWKINYSDTLDFTYPVYTSIWWNKSDRYIELKYKKDIEKNADCSISTKLQLYRTHYFSKFEEKKVNDLLDKYPLKDKTRKDVINIQWKWTNKAYVRVLLPKDIEVQPKFWMNVNKYPNATVLDFYLNTRLLESNHFDIEYRIKNLECKDYDFKLYKQPGIRKYNIEINEWEKLVKKFWVDWDYIYK